MAVGYLVLLRIQQAQSFLSITLKPWMGPVFVIRLLDWKVYTANAYLQVSTTEFGMWWCTRFDNKRITIRRHWKTDWIKFELWELIGWTTNNKRAKAVFNFSDYNTLAKPFHKHSGLEQNGPACSCWIVSCDRMPWLLYLSRLNSINRQTKWLCTSIFFFFKWSSLSLQ